MATLKPQRINTFQLKVKYMEVPERTQTILVKCTLKEAFEKGEAIYRADNLGLIRNVRVHSKNGEFIKKVKPVRGGIEINNDDD